MILIRRTAWNRCSRLRLLSFCWYVTVVTVFLSISYRLFDNSNSSLWMISTTHSKVSKLLALETNVATATDRSDGNSQIATVGTSSRALKNEQSSSSWPTTTSSNQSNFILPYSPSQKISTAGCPSDPKALTTWEEVQRCTNGRKKLIVHNGQSEKGKKKQQYLIRLVGERHSGTKFIIGVIRSCFRSLAYIDANRDFTRSKHFFQVPPDPPDHPRINAKKYRYDDPTKVIVIAVVRNPYDWVHAMIQQPYHTPNHVSRFQKDDWPIPLTWQEYVSRPWTMPRPRLDLERMAQNNTQGNICVLGMAFDEVIPCEIRPDELPQFASYREHIPVYELRRDGSGQPFSHILEMRAAKIRNFVQEIPSWNIGGYMAVRYDDLLANGTELMLQQLAGMIGLPTQQLPKNCLPKGPQPDRIGRRKIPSGLRTWIRDNMDVAAERLIGY